MKTVENHIVAFSDGSVDSIVYQHFVSELPLFAIHLIVESVDAAFFYLVEGEVSNIKITYPYDLRVAETLIQSEKEE